MRTLGCSRWHLVLLLVLLVNGVALGMDPESNGLFHGDFTSSPTDWQLGGNWSWQDRVLRHMPLGFGDAVLEPWAWTDFTAKAPLSVDEFGLYGSLRLMFRWQGPWVGYGLTFHENQTVLYRFDGAFDMNEVLASSNFHLEPGQTYDVQVTAEGNRFEVVVDGHTILRARDTAHTYTTGRFGIKADHIRANVEDVLIQGERQATSALRAALTAETVGQAVVDPRSEPLITGTFLHPDATTLLWDRPTWAREFDAMHAIGFDTLILQYAAYQGTAYYPSDVLPRHPIRGDLIDILLDLGEARGMEIWLGLSHGDGWATGDLRHELETNKHVIDELAQVYGDHPAFAGWYLPHELQLAATVAVSPAIIDFYAALADHARSQTPNRPVAIAPYFAISLWDNLGESAIEGWQRFLKASRVDVVMLQDGIGANPGRTVDEILPYYAVMREAADRAGVAFWNDLENFSVATWRPVPFEQVLKQLVSVAPYVDKTVIFEFNHYMSALRGWDQRLQYEGYKAYYENWLQEY